MTWIAYSCPGGWFGSYVPAAARPLVCKATPGREAFDRLDRAQKRVVDLGQDAAPALDQVRGLRLKDQPVTYVTTVKF